MTRRRRRTVVKRMVASEFQAFADPAETIIGASVEHACEPADWS